MFKLLHRHSKPSQGLIPIWEPNLAGIPAPVGFWPVRRRGGLEIEDLSGNGNTGTFVNAVTWSLNEGGPAVEFGGSNQAILCSGNHPSLINLAQDEITLISFIKPDTIGVGSSGRIMTKRNTATGTQGGWIFFTGTEAASIGFLTLDAGGGVLADARGIANALPLNEFHMAGVTYKRSEGIVRLYVDGIQIANDSSSNSTTTPGTDAGTGLKFGIQGISDREFDGEIGTSFAFNKQLSPTQMQFIYDNPYYAWGYLDDMIAIIAGQAAVAVIVPDETLAPTMQLLNSGGMIGKVYV